MADSPAKQAILTLFYAYQQILNTSSLPSIAQLYTTNSTCLFPQSNPIIGLPAILQAYEKLFNEVDHKVEITVDEFEIASPEWAFARTTCTGACVVRESGKEVSDR